MNRDWQTFSARDGSGLAPSRARAARPHARVDGPDRPHPHAPAHQRRLHAPHDRGHRDPDRAAAPTRILDDIASARRVRVRARRRVPAPDARDRGHRRHPRGRPPMGVRARRDPAQGARPDDVADRDRPSSGRGRPVRLRATTEPDEARPPRRRRVDEADRRRDHRRGRPADRAVGHRDRHVLHHPDARRQRDDPQRDHPGHARPARPSRPAARPPGRPDPHRLGRRRDDPMGQPGALLRPDGDHRRRDRRRLGRAPATA